MPSFAVSPDDLAALAGALRALAQESNEKYAAVRVRTESLLASWRQEHSGAFAELEERLVQSTKSATAALEAMADYLLAASDAYRTVETELNSRFDL